MNKKLENQEIIDIFEKIFHETVSTGVLTEMSHRQTIDKSVLGCYDDDEEVVETALKLSEPLGPIEGKGEVTTTGGDAFFILYLTEQQRYVKVQGYYNSYDATSEYKDATFSIVEPKQKTITVYE